MSVRLPDPFTTDGAPGFTAGGLVSNHPTLQDQLTDGRVLQVASGRQFWSLQITYPELFPAEYALIMSALEESKRDQTFVDVLLPQYMVFRVSGDTTQITVPAGQKGSTLRLTNTNTVRGLPLAGDLIQLTGGDNLKVYRITTVNNTVNDEWTFGLYPDLQTTTLGSENPEFNNILFQTVMLDWGSISNINVEGMYPEMSLSFREAK